MRERISAAPRFADVVAEQGQPVLLVAALGGGQCQQDVALLAGAPTGQVPVDGGFGALVGQVLAPTAEDQLETEPTGRSYCDATGAPLHHGGQGMPSITRPSTSRCPPRRSVLSPARSAQPAARWGRQRD